MEIKVAFFKGDGDWHNHIVRWWTKSPYSHAELVLPDGKTWISIRPFLTSKVAKRTKKRKEKKSAAPPISIFYLDIKLQTEFKQRKARAPYGEPPPPEFPHEFPPFR